MVTKLSVKPKSPLFKQKKLSNDDCSVQL